jgi:cyclic pyranopterin phosphate synthase
MDETAADRAEEAPPLPVVRKVADRASQRRSREARGLDVWDPEMRAVKKKTGRVRPNMRAAIAARLGVAPIRNDDSFEGDVRRSSPAENTDIPLDDDVAAFWGEPSQEADARTIKPRRVIATHISQPPLQLAEYSKHKGWGMRRLGRFDPKGQKKREWNVVKKESQKRTFSGCCARAARSSGKEEAEQRGQEKKLTHLRPDGAAHMVDISSKSPTSRLATAICEVVFSSPDVVGLLQKAAAKKGDVLATARIAGIMAAKKCQELIPLCHPIALTSVEVDLVVDERQGAAAEEEPGVDGRLEEMPKVEVESKIVGGIEITYEDRSAAPLTKTTTSAISTTSGQSSRDVTQSGRVLITATVKCEGKTGVEMEALTAASVAGLTVYDMCKSVDKGMVIEGLRVVRKEGGKSGTWTWEEGRVVNR